MANSPQLSLADHFFGLFDSYRILTNLVTKGMSCVLRLSIKPHSLKTFSRKLTRISKFLTLGPALESLVKCWCSKGIATLMPWTFLKKC